MRAIWNTDDEQEEPVGNQHTSRVLLVGIYSCRQRNPVIQSVIRIRQVMSRFHHTVSHPKCHMCQARSRVALALAHSPHTMSKLLCLLCGGDLECLLLECGGRALHKLAVVHDAGVAHPGRAREPVQRLLLLTHQLQWARQAHKARISERGKDMNRLEDEYISDNTRDSKVADPTDANRLSRRPESHMPTQLSMGQAARTAMLHPGMRESAVSPPASPSSWDAMPLPTSAHVLGAITFMRLCTKVRICGKHNTETREWTGVRGGDGGRGL